MDRVEGKTIKVYTPKGLNKQFQSHWNRIAEALQDIKHLGNVNVYLIKGRKYRLLFSKGY